MEIEILKKISEKINTPAYLFNTDELMDRISKIKKVLGETASICYAMKANPFLIKILDESVDKFEVCSPGEFAICERGGISPEKIVLSGVNKEYHEIKRVVCLYDSSIIYTIESLQHLEILSQCATENNTRVKVLIRLTSGNQFGLDETAIFNILAKWDDHPNLELHGIQFYSGTQKKKLSVIEEELKNLDEFCISLQERFNIKINELEYGPGFYIPYFENEELQDEEELLNSFKSILENLKFGGEITLEMGRFIASFCGYYFTSIVDKKKNREQNYCIIDGGINHINYYGQAMAMKKPIIKHLKNSEAGETENWNICGSLCTVSDVIIKQLPLDNLSLGDVLVFERLGAYSVTEGIYLFLSRDLPKIYLYSNTTGVELVRDSISTNEINSYF